MKIRDGKLLRCPFCGSVVRLISFVDYPDGNIRFGKVSCDCDVYPIVEGIIIFRMGEGDAVSMMEKGEYQKAVKNSVDIARRSKHCWLLANVWLNLFNRKADRKTFSQCLKIMKSTTLFVGEKGWFDYLATREKRKTFGVLRKMAREIEGKEGILLDAAGGAGHWINYLSKKKGRGIRFIIMDNIFWLMYLGRRCGLISSDAVTIVVDLEGGWPIESSCVNWVTANDCLHYIGHQKLFLEECYRVVKDEGKIIMGHVHKFGADNIAQGKGVKIKLLKKWLKYKKIKFFGSKVKSFSMVGEDK